MADKKTALITGATSGIGRTFAGRFASMGYDLIITGRRKKIIDDTAREISKRYGVTVTVVIAELSEEAGIRKVLAAIKKARTIDALVNNAGYGIDGIFIERKIQDHIDMITVHVNAALRLIHASLPGMISREEGIIINVSSLGAWTPGPINGIYGGTKAFLNIFTESLHTEVRKYGIKVQALCPGFTVTDFHKQMGVEEKIRNIRFFHWMKPEDVVNTSMKCLKKGKILCLPGIPNRLIRFAVGLIPRRLYYRMAEKST